MELTPGKRYAVTRIGTARNTDTVSLDSGGIIAVDNPNITVELLPDPLPTTPGSVVRDGVDDLLVIGDDGMWHLPGQDGNYSTDEFAQPVTVLFDAGAERSA